MLIPYQKFDLYQTDDYNIWTADSPGEKGAGVTFNVWGNTGSAKGVQVVLVCDSHQVCHFAYIYSHKLYVKLKSWIAMVIFELIII